MGNGRPEQLHRPDFALHLFQISQVLLGVVRPFIGKLRSQSLLDGAVRRKQQDKRNETLRLEVPSPCILTLVR